MHLLVAFLVFLVALVVVTAIVLFIVQQLVPNQPLWRNVILAVAALVLLIWLVAHAGGLEAALHG